MNLYIGISTIKIKRKDSPEVQSINQTSGYIDTYLFMSLVDMDNITNIFVSSCKEKSFLS
jgi:hypothetical protein